MLSNISKLATGFTASTIFASFMLTAFAQAGQISAIVEEFDAGSASISAMDLLVEGDSISLGKDGRLVLGYFRSCLRETIVGGSVTIGAYKSKVVGGKRAVEQVTCDAGTVDSSARKSATALGAVFRDPRKRRRLPKPDRTLFGISPIVGVVQSSTELTIERLDTPGQASIKISVSRPTIDLGKQGIKLEPGGLYFISDGATGYVIKISLLARDDAPLLSKFFPM